MASAQKVYVQVAPKLGQYNFIFGRDYLHRYGIDLNFSDSTMKWDGVTMDMKPAGYWTTDNIQATLKDTIGEPDVDPAEQWIKGDEVLLQQILDSKYEKQDLLQVSASQAHLSLTEQHQLEQTLFRYEELFAGTLGEWPGLEVHAKVKPDAQPYHCQKPIRIPHAYMETLKKEIERLEELGVIERVRAEDCGPWCAPSFIIPKKDQRIHFITDF